MFEYDDDSDESNWPSEIEDAYDNDEADLLNQEKIEKMKVLRKKVDWKMETERHDLLHRICPLIGDWTGPLPDLRDIFPGREIDDLLLEAVIDRSGEDVYCKGKAFIKFVARSGYKDVPELRDEDGKPPANRITALHRVAAYCRFIDNWEKRIRELFQIYDGFDVNYTDEDGLTHFHAACMSGCQEVVEKFLELGQDPDCVEREEGNSPLHLALTWGREEVAESLLRAGANPNLANNDGLTSLHIACQRNSDYGFSESFLIEIVDDVRRALRIDARSNSGDTPLHLALACGDKKLAELLLRRGANPSSANEAGETPLHIICSGKNGGADDSAKIFFRVNEEVEQRVEVDAKDARGRTPLQLAVANLEPRVLDVLLDNDADPREFVCPTESYFAKNLEQGFNELSYNFRLRLASGALACVESLEKRGYALGRSDATTVMKFFVEAGLCGGKSAVDRERRSFRVCENLKEVMVKPGLSLLDSKRLAYMDYYEFARSNKFCYFFEGSVGDCADPILETLTRGFFRRWALDAFSKLTKYQLPILCCDMIVERLTNEDLYRICLAAQHPSSRDGKVTVSKE